MSLIVKTHLPFFADKVGIARLFFFGGILILVATFIEWAVWDAGYVGFGLGIGLVGVIVGWIQISMLCEENSPHDFH